MKDVHNGLAVKNMSDLVLKEIYGKCERKNLTDNEIKKYKITEREIYEKYDNLSENEPNEKSNKRCQEWDYDFCYKMLQRWEKKKRWKKNRWTQKKINDCRIWDFTMWRTHCQK